ncbi:hypothetical protein JS532_08530 [Bifidobacterium callimiconis]|uniref:hypothetical protein n=1 Tax=Bifidobacterium callimiconis TaxID=2306973 RepID=UPI001BDBFB9D|nr:hypothetical protein [Bifidobacterium callimiconis]MBT1177601.1 hypothetical protein [Bifidobacterium callimiconis]
MHRLIIRMMAAGFGILLSLWMLWEAVYDLLRPAFYAWMKNTVGDIGAIVIFLALLCFCLYKLATYIMLLREGPRTAHGIIWEYKKTQTKDSDGDTVTHVTHTMRLDDGEILYSLERIPQSAFRDGMMWDKFITPGTYVIMTWYEKPFICVALRPDPEHPVPATADERHRIADPTWDPELDRKLDETMDRAFASAGNNDGSGTDNADGASNTADTQHAEDNSSEPPKPTIRTLNPKPFRIFNIILAVVMLGIIAMLIIQAANSLPFGRQGVYKNMSLGLVFACIVVWILVHATGRRMLLRRLSKRTTVLDQDTGERVPLPKDEIDAEIRDNGIRHPIWTIIVAVFAVMMLIGPIQTAIAGPQTVPVTYQGVEHREETDEDDGSITIYADFHFRTENGRTLTITTDWDQRTTIEQQAGQEGRHLLLTYWGNDQNSFDRVLIFDNAKADPKYE